MDGEVVEAGVKGEWRHLSQLDALLSLSVSVPVLYSEPFVKVRLRLRRLLTWGLWLRGEGVTKEGVGDARAEGVAEEYCTRNAWASVIPVSIIDVSIIIRG